MMKKWMTMGTLLFGLALAAAHAGGQELAMPVRVEAGGQAINIGGVGHSAPFLADVDGDGKLHLLVGTFSGGELRIYRNLATNRAPKFDAKYDVLLDGKADGTIPTG